MQLIENNTWDASHFGVLRRCFADSDEVLCASPFLSRDLGALLSQLPTDTVRRLVLVTTLKPRTMDQLRKIDALVSLVDYFDSHKQPLRYEIRVDNNLHGKVYLFKKGGSLTAGVVTSANFTDPGLSDNHEFGIELHDGEILGALERSVLKGCDATIDVDDVLRMLERVEQFRAANPDPQADEIDLDLNEVLRPKGKELPRPAQQIWVKPEGVTGTPISADESYAESTMRFHFSKRRPSGVAAGDKIVAYAVKHGKLLGVFTVVSDQPRRVSEEEIKRARWKRRWPWFLRVVNETPRFGARWYTENLQLTELVDDYLQAHPDKPVTAVGGQTLGALNYGHDKLRLAHDLGTFLIAEVLERNEALAAGS